jgi:hypothetical protein
MTRRSGKAGNPNGELGLMIEWSWRHSTPSVITAPCGPDPFGDLIGEASLLLADIVAKVENRATRKMSRKLIFGLLCRCVAFQRHYGGP